MELKQQRFPGFLVGLLVAWGGLGCARLPSACEPVCEAGVDRFALCLQEWGLTWGEMVGYTDEQDYRNWCQTWMEEQVALAEEADDTSSALSDLSTRCQAQGEILTTGTCNEYSSAWQ